MAVYRGRSTWSLDGMNAAAAILFLLSGPIPTQASDACVATIPSALAAELMRNFRGYRLPRESDNSAEDIAYAREHSGRSCLSVSSADFDGDGRMDFLIALTAKPGDGWIVVVALARTTHWKLDRLDGAGSARARRYVDFAPAGGYDDVGDYEEPREKGATDHITCPHSVAITGETEASAVAYCLFETGWKHVWIMD